MEAEDEIVSQHINIITEEAAMLSEEGNLIKSIKRENTQNMNIDDYVESLISILNKKIDNYSSIKQNIGFYKCFPN